MTPYFKNYSPISHQAETVIPSTSNRVQGQLFSWHPANATVGDSFFDVPLIEVSETQASIVSLKRKKQLAREPR